MARELYEDTKDVNEIAAARRYSFLPELTPVAWRQSKFPTWSSLHPVWAAGMPSKTSN